MRSVMSRKSPTVALLWMYRGGNAATRREQICQWNVDFELVEVDPNLGWGHAIKSVPNETEICILWSDDDKPVGSDFLRQMTQPLASEEDFGAVMHFWAGNAVSVLKTVLDEGSVKDAPSESHSVLRLLVEMLDTVEKGPNGRVHLALSSTERFAPLSMEPVGFPC
jgi:hypothetical protein